MTHIWRAKAKICSTFAFEFFLKFWTFVGSIQSSFLFSFQKYKFFWNRTKIDVFTMFFPWNYFLCARIPSFLNKMWRYCENNSDVIWYCESQCERNSSHIVTHIVRRLWGNCEWRWIPLLRHSMPISMPVSMRDHMKRANDSFFLRFIKSYQSILFFCWQNNPCIVLLTDDFEKRILTSH